MLRTSAAISSNNFKTWRLLLSSIVGGLFSIIIFIDRLSVIQNIFLKILFFLIIVSIAFGSKNIKSFLKCCASFALVNFAFAGIMFALCTAFMPNNTIYKNGIIYFDISLMTLTLSAIICYIILSLISRFTKSKIPQKSIYDIRVYYNNKKIEGRALFDSGNTLSECFSGRPVIISEKDFIRPLYEKSDITYLKNFRLVPYSTINNGGALPAFMADKIEIYIKGKWVESKEIYIAVTDKKIVSGGFSMLFGIPFYETIEPKIKGGMINI